MRLYIVIAMVLAAIACSSPDRAGRLSPTGPSATTIDTTAIGLGGIAGPMDVLFPSRAETFEFRNQLEVKYQNGLGRSATSTRVDREGEVVWVQEYIRYRVNFCDHETAIGAGDGADRRRHPGRPLRRQSRRPRPVPAARTHPRFPESPRDQVSADGTQPAADLRRQRRQRHLDAGIPALPRQRMRSHLGDAEGEYADRWRRRAGDVRAGMPLSRVGRKTSGSAPRSRTARLSCLASPADACGPRASDAPWLTFPADLSSGINGLTIPYTGCAKQLGRAAHWADSFRLDRRWRLAHRASGR